ncbi:uncharacterized protein SCHCODRAFT_02345975 [Schizophyllum commune H4-8]|nr:uncharacterized protein SCHCODRAFT_02345975 [Schizophyllum commune H4-8]KAI5890478.1 hypothetical protein SCHCODRAFT_02345975 [Schizophyllum commune H4-8]
MRFQLLLAVLPIVISGALAGTDMEADTNAIPAPPGAGDGDHHKVKAIAGTDSTPSVKFDRDLHTEDETNAVPSPDTSDAQGHTVHGKLDSDLFPKAPATPRKLHMEQENDSMPKQPGASDAQGQKAEGGIDNDSVPDTPLTSRRLHEEGKTDAVPSTPNAGDAQGHSVKTNTDSDTVPQLPNAPRAVHSEGKTDAVPSTPNSSDAQGHSVGAAADSDSVPQAPKSSRDVHGNTNAIPSTPNSSDAQGHSAHMAVDNSEPSSVPSSAPNTPPGRRGDKGFVEDRRIVTNGAASNPHARQVHNADYEAAPPPAPTASSQPNARRMQKKRVTAHDTDGKKMGEGSGAVTSTERTIRVARGMEVTIAMGGPASVSTGVSAPPSAAKPSVDAHGVSVTSVPDTAVTAGLGMRPPVPNSLTQRGLPALPTPAASSGSASSSSTSTASASSTSGAAVPSLPVSPPVGVPPSVRDLPVAPPALPVPSSSASSSTTSSTASASSTAGAAVPTLPVSPPVQPPHAPRSGPAQWIETHEQKN